MDEMKIKSSLMRGMLSKMISNLVFNKLGCKIGVQLEDIDVKIIDGQAHIHLDTNATMDVRELTKLTKLIAD